MRVLLVAATTGYQTRSFSEAARKIGCELVLATDRCHVLDDPWGDDAVALRLEQVEERVAHRQFVFNQEDALELYHDRGGVMVAGWGFGLRGSEK